MAGFVVNSGLDSSGNPIAAKADGNVLSTSTNGTRATFRYVASDVSPVATATDVLVLSGSSSKVIRVTKVSINGTATAASIYDHYVIKRTAANTGGTSTSKTAAQSDSSDAAQTATLLQYSANPSALGTGIAFEGNKTYLAASTTPGAAALPFVYTYGNRNDKAIVLRGTSESLAINFGGQAVPSGANLYISIEWTEDVA
jgi:hypothetical protein